jgi:hypothetical protein
MLFLASLLAAGSLGLAQPPYLGVACPHANVTSCGRIGIAVWLDGNARAVEATLGGETVRLRKRARFWSGFVHAELGLARFWTGSRLVTLRLTVRYPARTARGSVRATLRPGWG